MRIPTRIVDISMALDNETVVDPDIMRPKIEYVDHKANAKAMSDFFPGMKPEDLPDAQGWAWEKIQLTTHNGTHVDAPYHYHSHDKHGNPMKTIDQMPLDWYFRPAIKLTFRDKPDGYIVQPADVEAELKRIGHTLQPLDIVLVHTNTPDYIGTPEYLTRGIGMGREATLYLTERGVRVTGIDAWGWDAPFAFARPRYEKDHDASKVWQGHWAGIEQPYCHMEKLQHLDTLPDKGFWVACFPCKIKAASGGWTRAVAMFFD
ncbi:MAG: cyclase family protein [Alphaproteobacteria bacterium]